MNKQSQIYIAGINGMVGSAIKRELSNQGYLNVSGHSSKALDLTDQIKVNEYFERERPEYVFLAAAKVGGIYANNTYPADFIYSNLCIQNNIIQASYVYGVKKLLFLGSSCIYPKLAPQPIKEECLLTSELEPTNEPYAIAKICGIKMCEAYNKQYGTNFISCMPTNLYGIGDNYEYMNSHVIPGLIRKIHEAKERGDNSYTVWGTGEAKREFLFVNDLARACVLLMEDYSGSLINVGYGEDISIKELAELVCKVVGFKGELIFDDSKPDGTPRKLLDITNISEIGWRPYTDLTEGLIVTYDDFLTNNVRR